MSGSSSVDLRYLALLVLIVPVVGLSVYIAMNEDCGAQERHRRRQQAMAGGTVQPQPADLHRRVAAGHDGYPPPHFDDTYLDDLEMPQFDPPPMPQFDPPPNVAPPKVGPTSSPPRPQPAANPATPATPGNPTTPPRSEDLPGSWHPLSSPWTTPWLWTSTTSAAGVHFFEALLLRFQFFYRPRLAHLTLCPCR